MGKKTKAEDRKILTIRVEVPKRDFAQGLGISR